jgi:hypothetical protein
MMGPNPGLELGFKCRRRKFCLEPLCLPPELDDEQVSRSQGARITSQATKPQAEDW